MLELAQAEKAIFERLQYTTENKKVELVAMTSDLNIFRIPYDQDLKQLRLSPWIKERKQIKKTKDLIFDHFKRNEILLVEDAKGNEHLLLALHKSTSRLFETNESELPQKYYLEDLADSLHYLKRSLSGTGGFQGPKALLHLWVLRTLLKLPLSQEVLLEELSYPHWKRTIKENFLLIRNNIQKHAFTGRYDLREEFYQTIDEITRFLGEYSGARKAEMDALSFEKSFSHIEEQTVRFATWNLDGFFLSRAQAQIKKHYNLETKEYKTKTQVKQIARNIMLLKPQVLLVTEAEYFSMQKFAQEELEGRYEVVGGRGNDPLGKAVLLLVRKDLPVYATFTSHSNKRYQKTDGSYQKVFTRDLPVFTFKSKKTKKVKFVLVGAHLKALMLNSSRESFESSVNQREVELFYALKIVQELKKQYGNKVAVAGDFNINLLNPNRSFQRFMKINNLTNSLSDLTQNYSILTTMSRKQAEARIGAAGNGLSKKERRELALKYQGTHDDNPGVIDGIFVDQSISGFIRKAKIHRIVDHNGVVIPDHAADSRATDHNLVLADINLSFINKDSR